MSARRVSELTLVGSLVLAPLTGLAAALATPALVSSSRSEILAIQHHQGRYYLYAVGILLSSYLLVPAVAAIMRLMPESRPGWTEVAGILTQVGMLVAIGDAATELMFWQMGSSDASTGQMVALADRFESASGSSLIYSIGGLCGLVGCCLLAAALIRTRTAPAWSAVAVPVAFAMNVAGFAAASRLLLAGSYVVLGLAFAEFGVLLRRRSAGEPTLTPAPSRPVEARGQSIG
jgi:hypothetical protein